MEYLQQKYCFSLLKKFNIPIETIIDVGVFVDTPVLRSFFPDKTHILFEPIEEFRPIIENTYRDIQHKLYSFPLYEEDCEVKMKISLDENKKIKHSRITKEDCKNFRIMQAKKLDSVLKDADFKKPYFLKLDVDDAELEILKGAVETLKYCSVIQIEMHPRDFLKRSNFIEQHGFKLFDIVDNIYYEGQLRQFDMFFVKKDILIECNRDFENMKLFDPNLWKSFR
jgi:FkbM family methyltransferase